MTLPNCKFGIPDTWTMSDFKQIESFHSSAKLQVWHSGYLDNEGSRSSVLIF
ncbi:Uncharacterized protein dnm_047050 [Desulfonema magnum]|uniref:Uncharacterized protein n=1 Tax=Desulfonema magnum TaxID=45655 RepID=A0A975BNC3_9BACT|nr:Uncharacterized protein dnm_047050 [Desulfonema magnum]